MRYIRSMEKHSHRFSKNRRAAIVFGIVPLPIISRPIGLGNRHFQIVEFLFCVFRPRTQRIVANKPFKIGDGLGAVFRPQLRYDRPPSHSAWSAPLNRGYWSAT